MGFVIKQRDFSAVIGQSRQGVFVLAPKVIVPVVNALRVNVGTPPGKVALTANIQSTPIDITRELDTVLRQESHISYLKMWTSSFRRNTVWT